ncbi:DUF6471 domain-containing protein [Aromatoleum evansii]|uniref:DUF6471 domain-containing protein n=1 Tax=Aromatoleum evansii TaxID=59406 RepID=A0ABZ1AGH3_AROEV|nr:DUF6471 domain-containing protein [Aromatoleum evansii]
MNRPGRPISPSTMPPVVPTESEAVEMWGLEAGELIKLALMKKGWGYSELADALKAQGIRRSAAAINRRINRGNFSAGFLLACLQAMGCEFEVRGPDC